MKHIARRLAAAYDLLRRSNFSWRGRTIVYLSILVAALQGVAHGAALELYETGAPDLGTASAGRAAMAADASTAATGSFWVQVRGWVGERRVAREAAE